MTATTVSQFALELKMPEAALLEQLGKAGVGKQGATDPLTDQDKARLLDYLRRAHGDESKAKITLTRKQTSEIRATDSHGRARTVQVEVRKKRVLVKREAGDHPAEVVEAPVELPVAEPAIEMFPEPVVEVVPEPVVEAAVELVVETPAVESLMVEAPAVVEPESEVTSARRVVTRASVIGEEELKAREEQDRRYSQLRQIQEQELKDKQAREAELVRMRQQAEGAAEAAKFAEQARQAAISVPLIAAGYISTRRGAYNNIYNNDSMGKIYSRI